MRGEVPFYLFIILVIVWWNLDEEGTPELRTPRQGAEQQAAPEGTPLPGPSFSDSKMYIEDKGRVQDGTGTGFAVDRHGLWMTARHVVAGCSEVGFVQPGQRWLKPARDVWVHPNSDMALISGPSTKSAFELVGAPPTAGETAFHIGFPQGRPGDVVTTTVGRARMITTGRHRSDEPVIAYVEKRRFPNFSGSLGGLSGGPIFNASGQVVGVTVAENRRRGRVIGTAPRSWVRLFQTAGKQPQVSGHLYPQPDPKRLHKAGKRLRANFTVAQLICRA